MRLERRETTAAAVSSLALLGVFIGGVSTNYLYPALSAVLGIGLTLVPLLLRRFANIPLPWSLTAFAGAVTFLHAFGILAYLYDLIWWWDIMTHISATAVMAAGITVGLIMIGEMRPRLSFLNEHLPLVVLGLVIVAGVLWEVLEFIFDGVLGMNMQYSLDDTATDLTFDILGGALVIVLVPPYLPGLRRSYVQLRKEFLAETEAGEMG